MTDLRETRTAAPVDRILRVSIVEDDRTTREGLATLVGGATGCICVGTYGSVEEALQVRPGGLGDVVLLDINLPGIPGSEGARFIREHQPSTEVLMLTAFADDDKVFRSICNGAVGYLLKKTPASKLLVAIREAAWGGAPMSPEIARKVVTLFRTVAPPSAPTERLTTQEIRLLQLLADGHSYQAAALQLDISINTVRSHVRSVYEKLHVHSKSQAVSQALRRGLIR